MKWALALRHRDLSPPMWWTGEHFSSDKANALCISRDEDPEYLDQLRMDALHGATMRGTVYLSPIGE
jgi:hypothetical protein